jgi:hypothetical protein
MFKVFILLLVSCLSLRTLVLGAKQTIIKAFRCKAQTGISRGRITGPQHKQTNKQSQKSDDL